MKRLHKVFVVLLSMVVMVVLSFANAGAQTASSSPEKVWEISIGHHVSVQHHLHWRVFEPLAAEIAKESKGRIKPTVFPAAALGSAAAELDLCQKGVIDIAMVYPLYSPSKFPLTDVVALPFALSSAENGRKIVAGLAAKNLLDPGLNDRVLYWYGTTSPAEFFLKKKVTKYEDLKGLRLRTPGGLLTSALSALGAVPVTVPGAEFQNAFEKGVIDGGVVDFGSGPGYRLQDYTKNVVVADLACSMGGATMNKEKYNSLPPDLRKVIDKAMQNFLLNSAKSYDLADKDSAAVFEKAGAAVYVLPPAEKKRWMKATEPVYKEWFDGMKKKGLPIDKTYAEFRRLVKEYEGLELPLL